MNYSPFVYCYGQRNVAVTGRGTLNGQADDNHWWNWKNLETNDFDLLETMADDNVPVAQRVFADGHGGITIGSEMAGGVQNVYARDLLMNSANLQAGHRVKTNTLRGGFVENSNVYRITAGTIGGPVLLIDAHRPHRHHLDRGQLGAVHQRPGAQRRHDRRRPGH
jgi:polygalacturonase